MQKFGVQLALEAVREARAAWTTARRKFDADVEFVMKRLINEAAANYMSAEEVAKSSGLTPKRVRLLMRVNGLDPRNGKRLLASKAADALASNAALLGIEPHEMDLMSPLAYLPMGQQLRKFLETSAVDGFEEHEERRDLVASAIYGDGSHGDWFTTTDGSPNEASYDLADRVLAVLNPEEAGS